MKEKAPGTLTEWVSLYLTNGWAEFSEIKGIMSDMMHFLGPVSLDEIIEKAKELKESFEAEDPPEEEWRWEEKAEDWF